MTPTIALVTILTDDVPAMTRFYRDVLGFPIEQDPGEYVEFRSPGVRFALCARHVMSEATRHPSYAEPRHGQSFELAFPLPTPVEVDAAYAGIVAGGATPVQAPADMPWGQRAAFFADPDGNIHELFASLT
ncbi:MAG: VOC family protein [Chloroflexi bacterium]|nr:VOC family protein [Chloroflexota bacterium]